MPANSLVIRGGRVIDPAQQLDAQFDVVVRDGIIESFAAPGTEFDLPSNHRIDYRETREAG